ncbi:MAG: hypothetical protein ACTS41_00400 [Candidatus Hodgkinia cicadicola]
MVLTKIQSHVKLIAESSSVRCLSAVKLTNSLNFNPSFVSSREYS